MSYTNLIPYIICIPAMIICSYTDIKERKSKNIVTFPMMLIGLIYHFVTGGLPSLGITFLSLIGIMILMCPFSVFGGIGFGDVKFVMGTTALIGFMNGLYALVFSIIPILVIVLKKNNGKLFKSNLAVMGYGLTQKKIIEFDEKESAYVMAYVPLYSIGIVMAFVLDVILKGGFAL